MTIDYLGDGEGFADLDPTSEEWMILGEVMREQEAEEAGGDPLEGLDATPEERLAYLEALDEADEAEWQEAVGRGDDSGPDPDGGDGPWHDQLATLAEIGDQVGQRHAGEADRVVADITDQLARRPSSEAILGRALQRIGDGDYLPDPYFRGDEAAAAAARDPLGRYASACSALDDYGRCSGRFHSASCHVVTEEAAATGTATEAEAWRDTLSGRTPYGGIDASALGLANEPQPGDGVDVWADLLETGEPGVAAPGLHARLLHYMGEADAPAAQPDPGLPDVAAVREALGI